MKLVVWNQWERHYQSLSKGIRPTCPVKQERERTNVVQLQGTHSQLVVDTSLSVLGLTVIV